MPTVHIMVTLITSLQNGRIKQVMKLSKRRHRDEQRLTVVEGVREVSQALRCGVIPCEAFICPPFIQNEMAETTVRQLQTLAQQKQMALFEVTTAVFAKMAYRGDSGGLLMTIPYQPRRLDQLPLRQPPFWAIVDNLEKPGNLGAILRTADAAGADGIVLTGKQGTDSHNPNAIRASLGAFFTVPIAEVRVTEVIEWLRTQAIMIVAATPTASIPYTAVDLTGPVALVTGSEAYGLSRTWLAAADMTVKIPMVGRVDSLNLATATALLLYEVVRQRTT